MYTAPDAATIATRNLIQDVRTAAAGSGTFTIHTTITPDIAARLLSTVNLEISRRLLGFGIQQLTRAMRDGTFDSEENLHDPLTFSPEGNLRNGKQRLVALIMSGTTHPFTATIHPDDPPVQEV